MDAEIQSHDPLRSLAPNLFVVDGSWKGSPFGRRMTVVRLSSGQLVIHSAIRMNEKDLLALDSLGQVAWIVAPNRFHDSEAGVYAERYPLAKVLVPEESRARLSRLIRVDGTVERDWPEGPGRELGCVPVLGTRIHESVFCHFESRTLIVTDLVFNHRPEDFRGLERILMRWNRVGTGFGPSQAFKYIFLKNRKAFAGTLREIGRWDFDRVIMSHGRILESGGKKVFFEAFSAFAGT